jgi:hypothetical protein
MEDYKAKNTQFAGNKQADAVPASPIKEVTYSKPAAPSVEIDNKASPAMKSKPAKAKTTTY